MDALNLFKLCFAGLKDGGVIDLALVGNQAGEDQQTIHSYLKVVGFQHTNVQEEQGAFKIQGVKPQAVEQIASSNGGPPKIRRKNKKQENGAPSNGHGPTPTTNGQAVNPWANIQGQEPQPAAASNPWSNIQEAKPSQIDEDQLMKQSEQNTANFQKTVKQEMSGPKPCANCTCGLKE